jgi:hypothetical protein
MALFSNSRGASPRGSFGFGRAAALLTVAFGFLSSTASAQQYQADPVNDKLAKQGATVQGMAKDPAKYAAGVNDFDDYFTTYYFPAMTRFGEDDLAKTGQLRYDLFNRWLWATQNEEMLSHLTALAFPAMKAIVVKPIYHPAARYNAVLVIGMLDDKYGIATAGNQRPPKPLKDANTFLVALVNAGIAGKAAATPSLVVGALIGLERHAQYHEGLDAASIDGMTKAAITLASKNPPLADVDSKVAEWIRIEAATVLAKLGSVGPNGQSHDALMQVLSDGKLSLDGRCEVAGLLGLIDYKEAKVDGKATTDKMLQLAIEVSQVEGKRAKDFQELSIAGGGGAAMSRGMERGGRGGYGGGYSSSGEHSDYDRKTLLSRLGDLKKGLVAIKPIAPADRAAAVDTITSSVQGVMTAAANKDTTDLDLADLVDKMATAVQAAVKGGTATAAAKPAADAF